MNDTPKTLGQIGFNAYGDAGENPWKTWDGKPMPRWPEVSQNVRDRWEASANAIRQEIDGRAGLVTLSEALKDIDSRELPTILERALARCRQDEILHNGAVVTSRVFFLNLALEVKALARGPNVGNVVGPIEPPPPPPEK